MHPRPVPGVFRREEGSAPAARRPSPTGPPRPSPARKPAGRRRTARRSGSSARQPAPRSPRENSVSEAQSLGALLWSACCARGRVPISLYACFRTVFLKLFCRVGYAVQNNLRNYSETPKAPWVAGRGRDRPRAPGPLRSLRPPRSGRGAARRRASAWPRLRPGH